MSWNFHALSRVPSSQHPAHQSEALKDFLENSVSSLTPSHGGWGMALKFLTP